MSTLSTSYGSWYRLDQGSGRFVPLPDCPGDCDGILCVTYGGMGGDPENVVTQTLNATALVPTGTKRWRVSYTALKQAYLAGNKLSLTPA